MSKVNGSVQVILTSGARDPNRSALGLEAALAGLVSGVDTAVFLTLDATEWACEPRRTGAGQYVYELMDQLMELGARIAVCSACAADRCTRRRGSATAGDQGVAVVDPPKPVMKTTPGIELAGLAALMERVASGVPTVTF